MALDLNDPELAIKDLVTAYRDLVMAVIDRKLGGDELLTDEIVGDGDVASRFLTAELTTAIETCLAHVYNVDADELSDEIALLLEPED